MDETIVVQGRRVTPQDIARIRQLRLEHPDWSRRRLSQSAGRRVGLAQRTWPAEGHGRPHAAPEARGSRADPLPPRRQTPSNRMAVRSLPRQNWDSAPVEGTLARPGPADGPGGQCGRERPGSGSRPPWRSFTTWAYRGTVGENLQYTVTDQSRAVAGLPAVRRGGMEVPGAGRVHRLDGGAERASSSPDYEQHALPDPAVRQGCRTWRAGSWAG